MSGTNKPRVVFLNHWASRLGGAEYSLLDILGAAANRWECHLIATEDGALLHRARKQGVKCHIVPCSSTLERIRRWNLLFTALLSWKEWFHFAAYVLRLRKLVAKLGPRLVHANVPKSHAVLFLLCRLGYTGMCCFHIREIFGSSRTASLIYQLLFPATRASAIAISNAVKKSLPSRVRSRTRVIHNGVRVASAARSPLPAETLRLLYLGRIVPWKGCHNLLNILSLMRKEYTSIPVELDLIGDTAYWPLRYRHDLAAKLEELHLSPFCRILPHVEEPSRVFSDYHVFCNASFQEPFGRAIAEAQGNGLPVVCYDSGGVGEIVVDNETGFLVPDGNEALFAEALGRFVAKPSLIHEMGEMGRKRVAALFNRAIQAPLLCDFLQELIALRQAPQDQR